MPGRVRIASARSLVAGLGLFPPVRSCTKVLWVRSLSSACWKAVVYASTKFLARPATRPARCSAVRHRVGHRGHPSLRQERRSDALRYVHVGLSRWRLGRLAGGSVASVAESLRDRNSDRSGSRSTVRRQGAVSDPLRCVVACLRDPPPKTDTQAALATLAVVCPRQAPLVRQ